MEKETVFYLFDKAFHCLPCVSQRWSYISSLSSGCSDRPVHLQAEQLTFSYVGHKNQNARDSSAEQHILQPNRKIVYCQKQHYFKALESLSSSCEKSERKLESNCSRFYGSHEYLQRASERAYQIEIQVVQSQVFQSLQTSFTNLVVVRVPR